MRAFTSEEIEYQRKQAAEVRKWGGQTDYQLEYAFLRFMETGMVPTKDDYGHEIDEDLVKKYIAEEVDYFETIDKIVTA
jgi:hypothetical protein